MPELVAFVTGASRGIGRGGAAELARAGAHVYATGRSIDTADLPDTVVRIVCDHRDDDAVAAAFARVRSERGQLDILLNAAWGGYEPREDGFTSPRAAAQRAIWRAPQADCAAGGEKTASRPRAPPHSAQSGAHHRQIVRLAHGRGAHLDFPLLQRIHVYHARGSPRARADDEPGVGRKSAAP